jgi:site-specific recombinase XerD
MDRTPVSLSELAALYLAERHRRGDLQTITLPGIRWHLRSFCRFAGPIRPEEISPPLVDAWLSSERLARSTLRHRLSAFRTWSRWMILHGHLPADPARDLTTPRQPRPSPRTLPVSEVGRLVAGVDDPRLRLAVLLMAQEGLRACEVARAEVGDIDFAEQTIVVRGKGDVARLLPLSAQTWSALLAYVGRRRTSGALLLSRKRPSEGLTAQYVSVIVGQAMAAAGVAGTAHALRHSMAAHVLREGRADVRDVQLALGHASLATTSVYLPHSDVRRLRDVLGGRWYGSAA